MTTVLFVFLAAGLVFFAGTTLAAFFWAAKAGQFRDFDAAARSIFDDGEPVGVTTDAFIGKPGARAHRAAGRRVA